MSQNKKNIRIGLVGLGNRGIATLLRYKHIKEASFVFFCDCDTERCERANKILRERGDREALIATDWHVICGSPDVDLVYICTNWDSHAEIAIHAMYSGKNVAVEVPLATTVEDCNRIVELSACTGRSCYMLENCCFDIFHLGVLGMMHKGMLGAINHLEGAYMHYLAEDAATGYHGNPYPTHALGPICQIIGDDRLTELYSMDGLNSISNTLIKTEKGRSILLQFDETTPQPYNRIQKVCGTLGFVQKYPIPTVQINDKLWQGGEAEDFVCSFIPTVYQRIIEQGKALQVDNLMNYVMDCRLMHSLQTETPFDISVRDAALWSSVTEWSARSAREQRPISL